MIGDDAARPAPGTVLARLDDIADPGAVALDFSVGVARFSLILARRGGGVFGYHNRCPHARYPLERADGVMLMDEGRYLICAAHAASFRIEDGACVGGPAAGKALTRFDVCVADGVIYAV
jgi:nitrite reductase/ring-hydroxylating ferredoxin subunit